MTELATHSGSELKVSIHLDFGGLTMDAMDFKVDFYTSSSKVYTVEKAEMIRESEDYYRAVIDTTGMASGSIIAKVAATIPDSDCADGYRTEIKTYDLDIEISK